MTFKAKANYADIGRIKNIILSIEEKYNLLCLIAEICERKLDNVTFIHTALIDRDSFKPVFLLIVMYKSKTYVLISRSHGLNEMVDMVGITRNELYVEGSDIRQLCI